MDLIALPQNEGGPLDETVRVLFQLQSQALKAAQAQADTSQAQIGVLQARIDTLEQQVNTLRRDSQHDGCDARAVPCSVPPSDEQAREATVAAITQLDAKTKRAEEQDEPAVTYDRVRNSVIAYIILMSLLLAFAPFTGGVDGKAMQVWSGVCYKFKKVTSQTENHNKIQRKYIFNLKLRFKKNRKNLR